MKPKLKKHVVPCTNVALDVRRGGNVVDQLSQIARVHTTKIHAMGPWCIIKYCRDRPQKPAGYSTTIFFATHRIDIFFHRAL